MVFQFFLADLLIIMPVMPVMPVIMLMLMCMVMARMPGDLWRQIA